MNEIDSGALDRVLRMGGPGLLGRLVEAAFGNLVQRRGELAAALAAGDAAAAERAAHSIKSSSANLGASQLGALAAAAEALARRAEPGWREAAEPLLSADLVALRTAVEAAGTTRALAASGAGDGNRETSA